jgi:hypothetical protein
VERKALAGPPVLGTATSSTGSGPLRAGATAERRARRSAKFSASCGDCGVVGHERIHAMAEVRLDRTRVVTVIGELRHGAAYGDGRPKPGRKSVAESRPPILRIRDRKSGTAPGESIGGLPAICGRDFRAAWIVYTLRSKSEFFRGPAKFQDRKTSWAEWRAEPESCVHDANPRILLPGVGTPATNSPPAARQAAPNQTMPRVAVAQHVSSKTAAMTVSVTPSAAAQRTESG